METRGTILLVEDTIEVANPLREVLTWGGYRVLVAPTVEIGVQILRAFRVGLVLTDTFWPASAEPGDHWADLDRLVCAAGAAPLVLCASDEPPAYAEHVAHGFVARLAKPLNLDALPALVDSLLLAAERLPAVAQGSAPAREA